MATKNKKFTKGQTLHMVGVAGIGMSALASFLCELGCTVRGSDMLESTDVPKKVKFYKTHKASHVLDETDVMIVSHAIPIDNPEYKKAQELGVEIITYPEAVARLTQDYKLIAVAGTHGKSTTTAMLAKILIDAGLDPSVIVGTRAADMDGKNFRIGKSKYFVLEACEYKEAFLHYHPDVLVLTNIEADHLDYYETAENYFKAFKKLLSQVKKSGVTILNVNDPESVTVAKGYKGNRVEVDLDKKEHVELTMFGRHNQFNAWQAIEAAKALKVKEEDAITSLKDFQGTWRRLEFKGEYNGAPVYDDYGHHPTEIRATLKAFKKTYPNKTIICVFQPHQYSRTHHLLDGFVEALQGACYVIVPNIYEVRDSEDDKKKIDADSLVEAINDFEGIDKAENGRSLEHTVEMLKRELNPHHVCIIMGAGDVTHICDMLFE